MASFPDEDSRKIKAEEEISEACTTDLAEEQTDVDERKDSAVMTAKQVRASNIEEKVATATVSTNQESSEACSTDGPRDPSNVNEEVVTNTFFPTETANSTAPESAVINGAYSNSFVEGTANDEETIVTVSVEIGLVNTQDEQTESYLANDIDERFSSNTCIESTTEPTTSTSTQPPADIEEVKNYLAELLLRFSESSSDPSSVACATAENSSNDSTTNFVKAFSGEPENVDKRDENAAHVFCFNADQPEEPSTFKWTKKNVTETSPILSMNTSLPKPPKNPEYYKEVFPGSFTVKPVSSSCFPDTPKPSTSSYQPNLKKDKPLSDYKKFIPRSFSAESPTPCIPESKDVSIKPLFSDYKEFVPRSLSVEPSISLEPLKSECKKFIPKSLRVEAPASSWRFKPEGVLSTPLSTSSKEFVPRSLKVKPSTSSSLPQEVLGDPCSSNKISVRRLPAHSFLATIDALLLVLEGTLAGAYRIAQNYKGPRISPVIENTMQSIRLSLETLRIHFAYTDQECFEPLASVMRDLLSPAVNLISSICPELTCESTDFYPPLEVPETQPDVPIPPGLTTRPEFLISAREIYGTTVYDHYTVPQPESAPRIPLCMNVFQDPSLGVFVTPNGLIRMQLPYTFQIDITIDGAISVRNMRDKTIATISACGNYSGIASGLCRVYQHGKVIEMHITDVFAQKNMNAKIGVRGIQFGGTYTPANLQLKDNGETTIAETNFTELDYDFISDIFINRSINGPANYEACRLALKESKEKTLVDGSVHFIWRDIKITQYRNGELTVNRKNGDFMIWCSPEIVNPYSGTEKKGVIKVVTPVSRTVSTVMTTPVRQNEKFFLGNLGNQWVYYNTRDFIVSNEKFSVGYRDEENVAVEAQEEAVN